MGKLFVFKTFVKLPKCKLTGQMFTQEWYSPIQSSHVCVTCSNSADKIKHALAIPGPNVTYLTNRMISLENIDLSVFENKKIKCMGNMEP